MLHNKRYKRHLLLLLLWLGYILAVYRGGIMGGIHGQTSWQIIDISQRRSSQTNTTQSPATITTTLSWNNGSLSFASIIATIGSDIISPSLSWLADSETLRERYERDRDPTTRSALVTTLFREWNYDAAYSYMMMGTDAMITSLPSEHVMLIMRNASVTVDHNRVDSTSIMTMLSRLSLSDAENTWHIALISLGQGDTESFLTQINGLLWSGSHHDAVVLIRQRLANIAAARDMPSYYNDGMIALSLFEHGYVRLAQTISLAILAQDPHYILPQQLLAYSALLTHEWRQAAWYFDKLIDDDVSNIATYQFFRGITAYWMGEYKNAILFFTQIDNSRITSDTIRYIISSYLALDDHNGASKSFKSLLSQPDMHNADMMLAREKIIFEPYMYQKDYSILQYDTSILDLYITRCQSWSFDQTVCTIGTIARDIAQRRFANMTDRLRSVNNILPRSYLSYLLAESLIRDNQLDEAKQILVKALSLTKDPVLQETIKKKLQSVL